MTGPSGCRISCNPKDFGWRWWILSICFPLTIIPIMMTVDELPIPTEYKFFFIPVVLVYIMTMPYLIHIILGDD